MCNNTNNIEVKPIINIKLDDIKMSTTHTHTTENDIIKELIKLEEKKVETIKRMYSLQSKIYECPKCKINFILLENNTTPKILNSHNISNSNIPSQFTYSNSLISPNILEPSKNISFIKKNFFIILSHHTTLFCRYVAKSFHTYLFS